MDIKFLKDTCKDKNLVVQYLLDYARIFENAEDKAKAKSLLEDAKKMALAAENQNKTLITTIEQKIWEVQNR